MEIYLLRDGKEVGPYQETDVRSWLSDGHVTLRELAWVPGLESWEPLASLFHIAEPEPRPEPRRPREPGYRAPVINLATPKQKAFLSFMGIFFSPVLTEEEAEIAIAEAQKDPKLGGRLSRWEEEKLDLHPELFAAEIQARRENRPSYFHKMVQTEGGDCFNGVTKAHCQVLVNFLDGRYPRWDARLGDATWRYFFPAVAEKYPQLVRKEWRPKLKFPEDAKVVEQRIEKERRDQSRVKQAGRKLLRPLLKALAAVALIALLAGGFVTWRHPELWSKEFTAQSDEWQARAKAIIRGDEVPPPVPKTAPSLPPSPAEVPNASAEPTVDPETVPEPTPPASEPAMVATEPAPTMPEPAPAPPMAKTEPEIPLPSPPAATPTAKKPNPLIIDSPGLPQPMEMFAGVPAKTTAPTAPATTPAPPAAIGQVMLTRPVSVQTTHGMITLSAGTPLKIVGRQGDNVQADFMGSVVTVPLAATNAR